MLRDEIASVESDGPLARANAMADLMGVFLDICSLTDEQRAAMDGLMSEIHQRVSF